MNVMAFNKTVKLGSLAIAAAVMCSAPAFAQTSTNLTGGSTQQQPTSFLNTDTAFVLQPGLQYVSAGNDAGRRGIGFNYGLPGGQLNVDLNNFAIAPAFGAGVGLGYKMPLSRGVALSVGGDVGGIGGNVGLGARVGLPMTWSLGGAWLSFSPALRLPALNGPAGVTSGMDVTGTVGVQAPIAKGWSVLAEVVPTYTVAGGAVTVNGSAGLRLSPSATTAVDFRLGAVPVVGVNGPTQIGLLSVTGHVGFF
jgi:hypothetical protein